MIAQRNDHGPRIRPLDPPYEPGVARTLERMMGSGSIEPLKLFRTVAHNAHLLDKLRSTGSYLLNFGTIDPLEREIVILRTCARCGSAYEWGVHVAIFARDVGLAPQQIEATRLNAQDEVWTDRQRTLVRLVDELHDDATVSEELWQQLAAGWTPAQLVELVMLVGQYHTVSFVTNAFGVEPEQFAAR